MFFDYLTKFRNHYILNIPNITKSIPITYLKRSEKENYANNYREFINKDEIVSILEKRGVNLLDIDSLNSLLPQFKSIIKSNTIILEMGSAFTINAAFIASNSHIIVINDNYGYYSSNTPFFIIFRKIMEERNNTVEIFSTGNHSQSFCVDTLLFEKRICDLFLQRKFCIVCNHSDFTIINSFLQFPIMAVSNDSVVEQFFDFILLSCDNCNCLQSKNMIDPSILYSDVYMNSYFSPTWIDHHEVFSKFILNNTNNVSFLEIGANRGDLYNLLSKGNSITYTNLDMFQHPDLSPEVRFIRGNCASFDFTGFTTVIASHVFEHLYTPLTFIENLRKAEVSEVFISIPNFDILLNEKSLIMIHSQHIFYCGYEYISYMFSLFNYRCDTFFSYNGNFKSYMFKFVLDNTISSKPVPSTNIKLYKDIYVSKIKHIQDFQAPPNCYITPSGIYGQFIYYFLRNKDNIIGFLDNNLQRHGKKLYGTDKTVFNPQNIDYNNSIILLCDCPYKEELKKQLQSYKKECNIIEI